MPKKTVRLIRSKSAHYCLCVKENNKALSEAIRAEAHNGQALDEYSLSDKGHGRIEERRVVTYKATGTLCSEWCSVQRFIVVFRRTKRQGRWSESRTFYISDLCLSAQEFCNGIRRHWAIENQLHWVKDAVMHEDACSCRTGNSPAIQAQLRSLILSRFRQAFRSVTIAFCQLAHNVKELCRLFRIL